MKNPSLNSTAAVCQALEAKAEVSRCQQEGVSSLNSDNPGPLAMTQWAQWFSSTFI